MCTLMAGSSPWVGVFTLKSIVERNSTKHVVPEKRKLSTNRRPKMTLSPYAFSWGNGDGLPNANEINRRNLHERQGPVTHLGCLQVTGV
jgi:hypothetical protein